MSRTLSVLFMVGVCVWGVWSECEKGWEGSDCSIYSEEADPLVPYVSSVESSKWKYYRINIQNGPVIFQGSLTQGLANTSVCDLDFFVQKDSIPSFGSWIDRDISTYKISTLHVDGASGTYYFGIYGYRGCNYTFVYRVIGSCDCEPDHGECEAGSSQCSCYTGYMGDKCATTYVPMESGMQDAKANALGWYYYGLDIVGQPKSISFDLMLGGEGAEAHNADLYVAEGYLPNAFEYDFMSPDGDLTHSYIHVNQPVADSIYYFGVYARESSKFLVRATVYPLGNDCVNNCSYHGTCNRGQCVCNPSFSGASCQKMTAPLILDIPQVGFVADSAWNFYSAKVDFKNDLVIHLQQTTDTHDCDMYVKADNIPNFFNYDYADYSEDRHYYLNIPNPLTNTWNIGVYGFTDCAYNITIHEATACDCPENAHGSCRYGTTVCYCHEGWGGAQCLDPVVPLQNGVVMKGFTIAQNKWRYFSLRTPKTVGVSVAIRETQTQGKMWLFMNTRFTPTLVTNEGADRSISSAYHQIALVKEFKEDVVTFGVFGNPYITSGNVPFEIVAWYAPF